MHYNEANSYLFVNGVEIHKFTVKDSEINAIPSCLANILKDFSVDNMKKTRLDKYFYDFSVVYDKFTAKDSEINAIPSCLANILKDFSVDNMKKTRLGKYFYDFSVVYGDIAVDDMLDIQKYLMKKHGIV